ncbi:hypothetical protein [Nonomuraea lactucae]|uniref:5'-methylthioadenosine/S-adenosylhomocysteine nucleosidase family protein n=1 Tax=Nonomuraea lactucae TaxID=2249762 RepID=UPI0013B38422|nr:hypothetical protein [Nonomuraea lactucae]
MSSPFDARRGSFLTARDAMRAARAVRAAARGRRAIDTVRPPGIHGLTRERAPLPVILYAAAREGRLVWLGPDAFAVLEPPYGTWRHGRPRGLLHLLDRRWDLLVFTVPPALALCASLGLAAARQWVPALLGPLLAVLYVTVFMTAMVGSTLIRYGRAIAGRRREDRSPAETMRHLHWNMPLCHCPAADRTPDRAGALLAAVAGRLRGFVRAQVHQETKDLGARTGTVDVAHPLLCLLSGATTPGMEAAILAACDGVAAAGVTFLAPGSRTEVRRPSPAESGSAFALFTTATLLTVVAEALIVGDAEHDACAPAGDCEGRPATFPAALLWAAWRLAFRDPPGVVPATAQGWVFGWLNGLLGLTFLLVSVVSLWRVGAARRRRTTEFAERMDEMLSRSTVLLLVATPVEWTAVIEAVGAHTNTEPVRDNRPFHTVLELGTVGGARVLLARTRPGATDPGAATLTARELIEQFEPDYLILTGICYGLREGEQRLGDVLVCTQLRVMDHRKVIEHEDGEPVELMRGDRVAPSVTLLDRFLTARLDSGPPRVHAGPMLSGSTLLNSRTMRARMIAAEPDAIGGEMEGLGVYAAAAKSGVDWIVVKAICDWGMGKNDRAQKRAARNAADLVLDVLRNGALDRPPRH